MPAPGNGDLAGSDSVVAAAMPDRIAALVFAAAEIVVVIAIVLLIGLLLVRMLRPKKKPSW